MSRVQWIAVTLLGIAIFANSTKAEMLKLDVADEGHPLLSLSTVPNPGPDSVSLQDSRFELEGLVSKPSTLELASMNLTVPTELLVSSSPMTSGHAGANLSPIGLLLAASATAVTPEPGTIFLMAIGALGVALAARRRRK
jgi:hypothetical protein